MIDRLADSKPILADLVEPVASIEALRCKVFRPHTDVQGSSPSALEPLQPDIHQLRTEAQIVMACEHVELMNLAGRRLTILDG